MPQTFSYRILTFLTYGFKIWIKHALRQAKAQSWLQTGAQNKVRHSKQFDRLRLDGVDINHKLIYLGIFFRIEE